MNVLLSKATLLAICATASSAAHSNDKRFGDCQSKLRQAKELNVLYDLTWESPKPPRVVVDRIYFTLPFDAKEGFADTVSCLLVAGDENKCANFDLVHWKTGQVVNKYKNCKLKP